MQFMVQPTKSSGVAKKGQMVQPATVCRMVQLRNYVMWCGQQSNMVQHTTVCHMVRLSYAANKVIWCNQQLYVTWCD